MRLFLVVQVISISLYGERHLVRPSHPTDCVTDFHVSFLSIFCPGNVLSSECLILRMVRIVFHVSPPLYGLRYILEMCVSVHTYVRHYYTIVQLYG